jgi:hypothetical protein
MAAWTASTMFALVVGALADTIGFSPLFAVLAVFDLLGAVVIWTVLKSKSAEELQKSPSGNRPRRVSIVVPGGLRLPGLQTPAAAGQGRRRLFSWQNLESGTQKWYNKSSAVPCLERIWKSPNHVVYISNLLPS